MKNKKSGDSRLVYSTETGRIKPNKKEEQHISAESDGIVRLFRESRKGSGVTLIKGLPPIIDTKGLSKKLKKSLGVGGSIKEGVIELQTDQREKIKKLLEKEKLTVKIAGG
jgi:translation initiation factor 1